MPTVKLVPSTYYLSSSSYLTVSSASNMYADTSSTTYATVQNTRSSTTSYYIYIRGFDFSQVPDDAEVSDISIKLKAYHSGGNTSTINCYDGTTAVSSAGSTTALSTSATVKEFTGVTVNWDTLKGYGSDFGIRINCRRSSKNTAAYIYIYGAEIDVTYTLPVYHQVTVTGDATPAGSHSVLEGSSFAVTYVGTSRPTVTDNGIDVSSQLVESTGGTTNYVPTSGTTTNFTVSNLGNAYTGSDSTDSATLEINGGSTTGTLYLDIPAAIPSDATIQSVSCSATLQFSRNGSSSGFTSSIRLYSGSTAKGSATTWVSSATDVAKTTYNLTVGSWTASELANARFYLTATNSASSTHRFIYVYGVTLTVVYSVSGKIYTYTLTNVTADHAIVVSATTVIVHATGVSLNKASTSIVEGNTEQLTATVVPSDTTDKSVTWSTSSSAIATVANGLVTAVSAGTATITVTTVDGGYTATCAVTVTALPRTQYKVTSTMVPGKSYLIASGNAGSVYLLSNESGGSRTLKGVAATVTDGIVSITDAVAAKCLFSCALTVSGNSVTTGLSISNEYLYCDNANGLRMNTVATLDRFWHYQGTKFWQFKSTESNGYSDTSTEYKYYLTWTNGNATDSHVDAAGIEASTLPPTYLFEEYDPSSAALYVKDGSTWKQVSAAYVKQNGSWIPTDISQVFQDGVNYVKGN